MWPKIVINEILCEIIPNNVDGLLTTRFASVCGAAASSTGSSKSSGTIDVDRSNEELYVGR